MSDEIEEPAIEELVELYPSLKEYITKIEEDLKAATSGNNNNNSSLDISEKSLKELLEINPNLKKTSTDELIDLFPKLKELKPKDLIEKFPLLKKYVSKLESKANSKTENKEEKSLKELMELYPKIKELNVDEISELFPVVKDHITELENMITDNMELIEQANNNIENQVISENTEKKENINENEEIEKLREKNREKSKEIEELNTIIDNLKKEIEKFKETNTTIQKKMTTLEADIYEKNEKIRQMEADIEDKELQLALSQEQFINLDSQFEVFKSDSESQIAHINQKVADLECDNLMKQSEIERLKKKQIMTQTIMSETRPTFIKAKSNQKRMSLQVNVIQGFNPNNTPLGHNEDNTRERANTLTEEIKGSATPNKNTVNNSFTSTQNKFYKQSPKQEELSAKKLPEKLPEIQEFDSEKTQTAKGQFENLEPEQSCIIQFVALGKRPFLTSAIGDINSLKNDKKITENLKEMLRKIQERKKYLMDHKRKINEKLEKLGVKIR